MNATDATDATDRHQLHGAQVVLMVEDVKKTVDFYCDILGFHFDFDWGNPPTHARVSSGDRNHASAARIRFEKPEPTLLAQKTCSIYMHIGVDMDELFQKFKSRGVEIVEEPTNRPWGRQFGIRDINGYLLQFLTSG
jgi:catechol 2,3-dioxygenase-like lactoylglutathione lyase family enzyme